MCAFESADEVMEPRRPSLDRPGPLLVLGQHVRVVQSGFGSQAAWRELLHVLGEGGVRLAEGRDRLGEGCFRLLAPRLLRQRRLAGV